MNLNLSMLLRSIVASVCVAGPLWLTTHLPSGSAFATQQSFTSFFGWQGALVVGSLLVSLLMARLLARL